MKREQMYSVISIVCVILPMKSVVKRANVLEGLQLCNLNIWSSGFWISKISIIYKRKCNFISVLLAV